jgi:23S rRNA (adenine2503-C2)-methyltransferase
MSNLSKVLRALLKEHFYISLPLIRSRTKSQDGSIKYLFELKDGLTIESVWMPTDQRKTLCISSQVGCRLACAFCMTGTMGLKRNLSSDEIIGQYLAVNDSLPEENQVTNIVFMGMGDPLLNYDNVLKAINLMLDDHAFGLSRRRITVSTSGIIPGIDRLKEDNKVSLAISLHASNNELRDNIVPINRSYPILDLLSACKRYTDGREDEPITIEYVMLKDINDSLEDAHNLVKCLRDIPSKVNLIPFNKFPETYFSCSNLETINAFRDILIKSGIFTITRKTRGDDIDAACGQLIGKFIAKSKKHQKNKKTQKKRKTLKTQKQKKNRKNKIKW